MRRARSPGSGWLSVSRQKRPQGVERAACAAREGQRQLRQVVALLEVRGVRATTREQHRVLAVERDGRVVPATPELVARVVVGGGRDPDRLGALGSVVQEHEHLLPVRLVVVGTTEGGAVVVHEVEEQVLEDDPAVPADDPTVIHDAGVLLHRGGVLDLGRGGRAARHRAAQQQRDGEPGVHQAREQAHAGEPAGRVEVDPVGSAAASGSARCRRTASGRAGDRGSRRVVRCDPGCCRRSASPPAPAPRAASRSVRPAGRRRRGSRPRRRAGTAPPRCSGPAARTGAAGRGHRPPAGRSARGRAVRGRRSSVAPVVTGRSVRPPRSSPRGAGSPVGPPRNAVWTADELR